VYGSPLRAFEVLCIAKYRYGENSAANPIFKNLFNTLKVQILAYKCPERFSKESQNSYFREKSPKLATLQL
jgi:hypothetical protein